MKREDFLHELKDIISAQKVIKYNIERWVSVEESLTQRLNILMDAIVTKKLELKDNDKQEE